MIKTARTRDLGVLQLQPATAVYNCKKIKDYKLYDVYCNSNHSLVERKNNDLRNSEKGQYSEANF